MPLSPAQSRTARMLYGLAVNRGLPPPRAREFVAAAYAESTLDATAINNSSGAAGLYQLLSSGYRQRAQQLGGLTNPRANALAILPSYQAYWRQHPRAAPGDAGRDVERSGEGSGFYSRPLSQLPRFGGGPALPAAAAAPSPPGAAAAPVQPSPVQPSPRPQVDVRRLLTNALAGQGGIGAFYETLSRARQQPQPLPQPAVSTVSTVAAGPPSRAVAAAPAVLPPGRGYVGKVIGTPGAGTHTLGDWASDRAYDEAQPVGTPVRAPFDGTIGSQFGSLGSSSSRFAGLRVHVVGQRNEAYYAHLSKFAPGIQPGTRVRAGQVIGYSGSANGVAHLHEALRYGNPRSLIPRS